MKIEQLALWALLGISFAGVCSAQTYSGFEALKTSGGLKARRFCMSERRTDPFSRLHACRAKSDSPTSNFRQIDDVSAGLR